MASPQTENGYTKIANELFDELCKLHLSGNEWSYIHALIRKTYGYQKKEDWVTNSQIVTMTGMRKERVSEAKRNLISRNIVTENRNRVSLQKDYEKWVLLQKTVTTPKLRKTVSFDTEKRNKSYGKAYTQKKKENTTKETSKARVKPVREFNPLGAEILKAFELVDPKNKRYYGNTTQRGACDFLLQEYGLEEVLKRVQVLPKTNKAPFFPTITTPLQLQDKWVQLHDAVERRRSEVKEKNKVAFT